MKYLLVVMPLLVACGGGNPIPLAEIGVPEDAADWAPDSRRDVNHRDPNADSEVDPGSDFVADATEVGVVDTSEDASPLDLGRDPSLLDGDPDLSHSDSGGADESALDAPKPCIEGLSDCEGSHVRLCVGGAWTVIQPACATACLSGKCTKCKPGALSCEADLDAGEVGDWVTACDATGSKYQRLANCNPLSCTEGKGCWLCMKGEVRCRFRPEDATKPTHQWGFEVCTDGYVWDDGGVLDFLLSLRHRLARFPCGQDHGGGPEQPLLITGPGLRWVREHGHPLPMHL